ncbi:MAG: YceI family protein [Candidatus Sericytochromatia bacterium]|nr:YceI family protein [Candidatus Tanganyikabacteria bacterium]
MAWILDAAHSSVGFAVKHLMVSTVRGQFKTYSATIDLDPADVTRSKVSAEIDAASLDTRDEKRDEHLRSADFFDVANHPKLTFESKRIDRIDGDTYRIVGDLTIRGTTRVIALDAEFFGMQKSPWGDTRTGFSLRGTLNRKDFDLTWNVALETGGVLVGDKVTLEIEVEAIQPAQVPAAV